MTIDEQKKELRRLVRALKHEYTLQQKLERSVSIQKRVLQLPELAISDTILLYHALPDEVNTDLLLESLSNRRKGNKRIALPVVDGDNLILKEYIPDNMSIGYNNILEPAENDIIDPSEIDFAIIPGMAFDRNNNRMGRGKGFYDRLLNSLNCKKIGIAFRFQIFDSIPCGDYDLPMDMVISED